MSLLEEDIIELKEKDGVNEGEIPEEAAMSVSQAKAADVDFKDVPKNHANYQEIMFLLEKGVIAPGEKYGVNDKVTREEVAVMVAKAVGLDGKKSQTKFKDVPSNRYLSGYINSAVKAGIIIALHKEIQEMALDLKRRQEVVETLGQHLSQFNKLRASISYEQNEGNNGLE